MASRSRRRRDRDGRDGISRRHRRPRGRRVGDHGRGREPRGRPRHHLRRQPAARRRHQLPEEIRHRGFGRPVLPGPDRLVGGRAQRLSALPLQRPRDHPRVRRQQRGGVRISARARRQGHRPAAEQSRPRDRQLGAAHHADLGRGLADGPHRRAGQSGRRRNPGRRRPDPAAGSGGAQGRHRDPARAPHDRDPPRSAEVRPRHRHRRRLTTAPRSTSARARR